MNEQEYVNKEMVDYEKYFKVYFPEDVRDSCLNIIRMGLREAYRSGWAARDRDNRE